MTRSEALHFDEVAVLILQLGGDLVEGVLGLLAQCGLAGAESNLGLRGGLVLIDVPDHGLDRGEAGVNGGCRLIGQLHLVGGIQAYAHPLR